MASSQLNVFAGGLTDSLYRAELRPDASERELLWMGRLFSLILGAALIVIAIFIPVIGGAAAIVISMSSLIIGNDARPFNLGTIQSQSVRVGVVDGSRR